MKLRSILFATFTSLAAALPGHAAPPATAAGQPVPVLWSLHFDAERLRSGAGQELFSTLDPLLTSLSGRAATPGGKLESLAICGLRPEKDAENGIPLLADLRFSAEGGGISQRFEAISKKHDAPVETVAGFATIHFDHLGKQVWIAKFTDSRLFLSTSQPLLVRMLTSGGTGSAAASPDEILGGDVEIAPLLAADPALRQSALLKLLPHLDFHVVSQGSQLDLDASADLDSDHSARRAARMIEGMTAALSMREHNSIPWDDRLVLDQHGSQLSMHLHLEAGEAKTLFDQFAHEIQARVKSAEVNE